MHEMQRYEQDRQGRFPLILNKPQLADMEAAGADFPYMLVSTTPVPLPPLEEQPETKDALR